MATFLVVGGAGYIGSHVARALQAQGHRVVVLDDLSRGHREAVSGFDLVVGDLGDPTLVRPLLAERRVDCVMHFAALALVGESMADPLLYWETNVGRTARLLTAIRDAGVRSFVFSSSAAVYGEPTRLPIVEDDPRQPTNPYGRTKLVCEQMLADCDAAWGLRHACLRYFNAAGADPGGSIGEDHEPETHVIPLLLQVALGQRPHLDVFGTDWDTPDGTCVRDFVHVTDLAEAHILAAERLLAGGASGAYNLGSETGFTVLELAAIAREVTGQEIPVEAAPRRAGDPARLVASAARARAELGWTPRLADPRAIVETAWRWHREHPNGYRSR